jgi:K+-transporting ATPase ATPase C chain
MKNIVSSTIAIVLITACFGFAYPAAMTAFGQVAFPSQANGSLIKVDGVVVGSKLAAQPFTSPRYFHERPSATTPPYNAGGTAFSNLGPTNPDLAKLVRQQAEAILRFEGDAVTTSGSGIDPDISPAYAALQSRRVAAVRHLPLAAVQKLIRENTDSRSWGFFGEPGVNVLKLNLALDRLGGR